jgi:hypothetical protein
MRVVVAFVGVIVVLGLSLAFDYPALDCLGLNRLIFRGLGLVWLARRIVWLAFLCCFPYPVPLEEDTAKSRFLMHVPQTISLRDVAVGVKWGRFC